MSNDTAKPQFNRPPRIIRQLPREEIEIPAPPSPPRREVGRPWFMILLPALTGVFYLIALIARGGQGSGIWLSLPIVVISFASVGIGVWNYFDQKRRYENELMAYQNHYSEVMNRIRRRLTELTAQQEDFYRTNYPDSSEVLKIVEPNKFRTLPKERLWERRPTDNDFLELRVGIGERPTSLQLKPPKINEFQFSNDLREILKLVDEFRTVKNVPITFSLPRLGSIGLAGGERQQTEMIYWLLWQIVVHHAPQEVRVAAFWSHHEDRFWNWLHWLPHTKTFDDDSYRLLAHYDGEPAHLQQVVNVLQNEFRQRSEYGIKDRPCIVIVFDRYVEFARQNTVFDAIIDRGRELGMYAICIVPEARLTPATAGGYLWLDKSRGKMAIAGKDGGEYIFTLDSIPHDQNEALARKLASLDEIVAMSVELPRSVRFSELLELGDLKAFKPEQKWDNPPDPGQSWKPVAVGLMSFGKKLEINLNEGIHGVHGIIAGTTGSGKSEFLLTFLMALAVHHDPDRLNLLLIDFKGGATFKDIADLPHTVGMITDLSGNETERALIAINSELDRRKQRLQKEGVSNIREYRRRQQQNPALPPMPNLMIAIDEFDEMMRDFPEFVDELIRVAKQGRSLGVHLLFATQQPSLVKEGLTRNLTYRIALRVTSAEDSKTLLGIPDAAYLTTETPGRAYFRVNKDVYQFQSARITLPYKLSVQDRLAEIDATGRRRVRNTVVDQVIEELQKQKRSWFDWETFNRQIQQKIGWSLHLSEQECERINQEIARSDKDNDDLRELIRELIDRAQRSAPTELTLVIEAMREAKRADAEGQTYAMKHYRIWQAPLPAVLSLSAFIHELEHSPSAVQVPLGRLDYPVKVQQPPFIYRPLATDGHLLVIGASRSGKTTLLRTLMLGLAYAYPPDRLWLYTIDPTGLGCGLRRWEETPLPHLADSLTPDDKVRLDRLLVELEALLEERRRLFREHGVENVVDYYRNSDPSRPPLPVVFVIVDGVGNLTEEFSNELMTILRDGRLYGIVGVVTGSNQKEVRAWQSLCETRVVLRVTDNEDSEQLLGRKNAARIPVDRPGRAYLRTPEGPVELQIALPIWQVPQRGAEDEAVDDVLAEVQLSEMQSLIKKINQRYSGVKLPQPLRLPPERIALNEILQDEEAVAALVFAQDTLTLTPVGLANMQHLLIAGTPGTGKSTAVRTLLTTFMARFPPDELQFILIDYRKQTLQVFAESRFARKWQIKVPDPVPVLSPNQPPPELKGADLSICMATDEGETVGLCVALAKELRDRLEQQRQLPRLVLVVNDIDLMMGQDLNYLGLLTRFARRGSDLGFHMIVTATTFTSLSSNSLIKALLTERYALHLGKPDNPMQDNANMAGIEVKWSKKWSAIPFPPGRGILRTPRGQSIVQVAYTDDEIIEQYLNRFPAEVTAEPAMSDMALLAMKDTSDEC